MYIYTVFICFKERHLKPAIDRSSRKTATKVSIIKEAESMSKKVKAGATESSDTGSNG